MRAGARDVPLRPNPLMAMWSLASVVVLTAAAWCVEGRRGSATGRCRRVETRGVHHGARRFRGTWDASRNNSSRCASQRAYLDSLAALETGGLAAELNLKPRGKRKEGAGSVTCVASSSCARHTAMPSDGPRRHTADRAFFARRAVFASGNARRAPASSARGSTRGRTFREGVVAAKAAILLVMVVKGDGCVRV